MRRHEILAAVWKKLACRGRAMYIYICMNVYIKTTGKTVEEIFL